MKNIRWQLVEGVETVNPKEIPFLRLTTLADQNELLQAHFQEAGEVPVAMAKNDKEEILGVAYYKLRDFAPNSLYAYDGTLATAPNRPSEAIDRQPRDLTE